MANEMDFLRYAYSPPRTFMKRTAGLLPAYQFPQEVMYGEPGTYSTADMMPPAQQMPAAVPPPATFAPRPNPLLDESPYIPTPRPVQQPFDFSRFQYPEAPRYRMPGAAPARDLGMERGFTQQRSLRAALLGALLGGGTGAIAGLTGAQQGAQQAFEQDYAQRMADYQNQARLMDIENQQLAAADQRAIAMRNAQVGEALKAYGMEGEALQNKYLTDEAVRQGRLALANARAANDKDTVERVSRAMGELANIDPKYHQQYMQVAISGDVSKIPPGGFPQFVKPTGQITGATLARLVSDFKLNAHRYTDADFAQQRAGLVALIMASPNEQDRLLANQLPVSKPKAPMTVSAAKSEAGILTAQQATALNRAKYLDTKEYRNKILAIRQGSLDIANRRERRLANASKNTEANPDIKSDRKTIESQFRMLVGQLNSLRNARAKDKAAGFVPQIDQRYETEEQGIRSQLAEFAASNSDLYEFSNVEAGIPTLRPKRLPAGDKPSPSSSSDQTPGRPPKPAAPKSGRSVNRAGWSVERVP